MVKLNMIFLMIFGMLSQSWIFAAEMDPVLARTMQVRESLKDVCAMNVFFTLDEGDLIKIQSQKEFVKYLIALNDNKVSALGLIQWFATSKINKESYDHDLSDPEKLIIRIVKLMNEMHQSESNHGLSIPTVLEKMLRIFGNALSNENFQNEVAFLCSFKDEVENVRKKIKKVILGLGETQEMSEALCNQYSDVLSTFTEEFEFIKELDKTIIDVKEISNELSFLRKIENKIESLRQVIFGKKAKKDIQIIGRTRKELGALSVDLENEAKRKCDSMIGGIDSFIEKILFLKKQDIRFNQPKKEDPLPLSILNLSLKIEEIISDFSDKRSYVSLFIEKNKQRINDILKKSIEVENSEIEEILIQKGSNIPLPTNVPSPTSSASSADSGVGIEKRSRKVTDLSVDEEILKATQTMGMLSVKNTPSAMQESDAPQDEVVRRNIEEILLFLSGKYAQWSSELLAVEICFENAFRSNDNVIWFYHSNNKCDINIANLYSNRKDDNYKRYYSTALKVAHESLQRISTITKEFNAKIEAISALQDQNSSHSSSRKIPIPLMILHGRLARAIFSTSNVLAILVGDPILLNSVEACAADFEEDYWPEESSTCAKIGMASRVSLPVDQELSAFARPSDDQDEDILDYQESIEEKTDGLFAEFSEARQEFVSNLQEQQINFDNEFSINDSNRLEFKYSPTSKNQKKDKNKKNERLSDSEIEGLAKVRAIGYMKNLNNTLLKLVQNFSELKKQCEAAAHALLEKNSASSRGLYFLRRACDLQKDLDIFYASEDYAFYKHLKKKMGFVCSKIGCELVPVEIPSEPCDGLVPVPNDDLKPIKESACVATVGTESSEIASLYIPFNRCKEYFDMVLNMFFEDFSIEPNTHKVYFQTKEKLSEIETRELAKKRAEVYDKLFNRLKIAELMKLSDPLICGLRKLGTHKSKIEEINAYLRQICKVRVAVKFAMNLKESSQADL